jgi:hypothetical protein
MAEISADSIDFERLPFFETAMAQLSKISCLLQAILSECDADFPQVGVPTIQKMSRLIESGVLKPKP